MTYASLPLHGNYSFCHRLFAASPSHVAEPDSSVPLAWDDVASTGWQVLIARCLSWRPMLLLLCTVVADVTFCEWPVHSAGAEVAKDRWTVSIWRGLTYLHRSISAVLFGR